MSSVLGTGLCEYRMKVGEFHITVDKTDEKEVVSEDEGTREILLHGHGVWCS